MTQIELYQSVLQKLSAIPVEYLLEVDKFLTTLQKETKQKDKKGIETLSFAGSWNDMSDEDFEEYKQVIKETRKNLFNREIEL